MKRMLLAAIGLLALVRCGLAGPPSGGGLTAGDLEQRDVTAADAERAAKGSHIAKLADRRAFAPRVHGRLVTAGISYGPHRRGQRPGGAQPSAAQLLEDLQLLAGRWQLIRLYGSRGVTEDILRILQRERLPIVVMLGAWIAPDAAADNNAEVAAAITLANRFPEQVVAVSVGNETQVAWSAHRSPPQQLIEHIRAVRSAIRQPVTTADDYNFWNKPASHAVADEVDMIVVHAYAMWNGQQLANALSWTQRTVASIRREHPHHQVVLGETGWATQLNADGNETKHIKAVAGEREQAEFYSAFSAWAAATQLPYFYFEAFDEPWKGGSDARDVEKHWGLYRDNRTPKPAIAERAP